MTYIYLQFWCLILNMQKTSSCSMVQMHLILDNFINVPANLDVNTLSYCSRIWSSRSLSMRSHTRLTCLNVKSGKSFLLGERALKNVDDDDKGEQLWEVEGDALSASVCDDDPDATGLALWCGNCNCLRLCIRFISSAMLAAICSAKNMNNLFNLQWG